MRSGLDPILIWPEAKSGLRTLFRLTALLRARDFAGVSKSDESVEEDELERRRIALLRCKEVVEDVGDLRDWEAALSSDVVEER